MDEEKIETTITTSFTGKISVAQWENVSPFFSFTEKYNRKFTDEELCERQRKLQSMCKDQFKQIAEQCKTDRTAEQYKNIRWYEGKDGLRYPSVTSVIGLDKDFHIPQSELSEYGSRGTILHKQAEIFLKTGEWKDAKDIAEVSTEYMTVVQGSLGLALDDVDFRGFIKSYPIKVLGLEETVINHEHRYGGRLDIRCIIEEANAGKWSKIEGIKYGVETLLDIKTSTTLDKTYGFTQNSAYSVPNDIQQMGLIHLSKTNKCGYATPVITSNIPRFWDIFIKKRKLFTERYGV